MHGTNELAETIVVYVGNDIPDRVSSTKPRVVDSTTRASFRVYEVAAQEPRVFFATLCDASSTIHLSVSQSQTFLLDLFGVSSTTTEIPAIKLVTILALVTKQIKQGRLWVERVRAT